MSTKQIVALLAQYWMSSPSACDTAEGIRRWWLAAVNDASVGDVECALMWLVEQGVVESRATGGGRVIYRLHGKVDLSRLQSFTQAHGYTDHGN